MDALDEFKVDLLDNGCHIRSDLEQSGTTLTSDDPIQIATIRWMAAALINRTRQRDEAREAAFWLYELSCYNPARLFATQTWRWLEEEEGKGAT